MTGISADLIMFPLCNSNTAEEPPDTVLAHNFTQTTTLAH